MEPGIEFVLEPIKFKIEKRISRSIFDSSSLSYTMIGDEIVYEFIINILGQKKNQVYEVSFDIAKNWWEHFKLDMFPLWLKNLFPVKFRTVVRKLEFDQMALFPELEFKDLKPVIYSRTNEQIKKQQ